MFAFGLSHELCPPRALDIPFSFVMMKIPALLLAFWQGGVALIHHANHAPSGTWSCSVSSQRFCEMCLLKVVPHCCYHCLQSTWWVLTKPRKVCFPWSHLILFQYLSGVRVNRELFILCMCSCVCLCKDPACASKTTLQRSFPEFQPV